MVRPTLLLLVAPLVASGVAACGSRDSATPQGPVSDAAAEAETAVNGDAGATADATSDGTIDAGYAAPDAGGPDAAVDAGARCNVRTSGTGTATLDPTFQTFTWSPPSPEILSPYTARLAVAPAGDAFVGVQTTDPAAQNAIGIAVLHVTASGALDTTFGTDGLVGFPDLTSLDDVIVDARGDVVVTGRTAAGGGVFDLHALRPDGTADFSVGAIDLGFADAGAVPVCPSCIVQGADGYIAMGPGKLFSIAPNGQITAAGSFAEGATGRISTMLETKTYIWLPYSDAIYRFDLHGVAVAGFGDAGAIALDEPSYVWPAADESLFLALTENTTPGPDPIGHLFDDGGWDPAYPPLAGPSPITTPSAVWFGAARCDGTNLLVEGPDAQTVTMQLQSAGSPTFTDAGSVTTPGPDGASYAPLAYSMNADGAVVVLQEVGEGLELVRVLPSR